MTDNASEVRGKTIIPSIAAVKDYIGTDLGISDWVEISQERIDTFAGYDNDIFWVGWRNIFNLFLPLILLRSSSLHSDDGLWLHYKCSRSA